jgi:hypothetical protein
MKSQWMFGVFAACALAGACGSDKDDAAEGAVVIETTLPLDKKVSELGDADFKQLCKEVIAAEDTALGATQERYCALSAELSEGFEAGSCQKTYDTCLSEEHKAVGKKWTANDYGEGVECDFPSGCDATVAELKRCYEWDLSTERDAYDGFSCKDGEPTDAEEPEQIPEQCKALHDKCPAVFEE